MSLTNRTEQDHFESKSSLDVGLRTGITKVITFYPDKGEAP
jgi:hypothetical protein